MNSSTSPQFWTLYRALPEAVRQQARQAYTLSEQDPHHPSLRFRQVHPVRPVFSVRIGSHHRAACIRQGGDVLWFWIGSHAEYDSLLRRL